MTNASKREEAHRALDEYLNAIESFSGGSSGYPAKLTFRTDTISTRSSDWSVTAEMKTLTRIYDSG